MRTDRIPIGFVSLHSAWHATVARLREVDPAPPPTVVRHPTEKPGVFEIETIRTAAPEEDEAGPLLCLAFERGELVPQYWPDGWNAPEGCGIDRSAWSDEWAIAIFDRVVWQGGFGIFPESLIGHAPCVDEKALRQWLETRLPELRGKSPPVGAASPASPPRQVGDTVETRKRPRKTPPRQPFRQAIEQWFQQVHGGIIWPDETDQKVADLVIAWGQQHPNFKGVDISAEQVRYVRGQLMGQD